MPGCYVFHAPRDLPDLPALQGLTWTTLPYYFEVVVTLRKLVVVFICGYMGGPSSSVVLHTLLGVVLLLFTELVVGVRPYNDNKAGQLDEALPHNRRLVALRRGGQRGSVLACRGRFREGSGAGSWQSPHAVLASGSTSRRTATNRGAFRRISAHLGTSRRISAGPRRAART